MLTDIFNLLIGIYAVQFFVAFAALGVTTSSNDKVFKTKKDFMQALIPFSWFYEVVKITHKAYKDLP